MHENAQGPYRSASVRAFACYNIITMAHHFAKFMASPQFNHNCDISCKVHSHQKSTSFLKRIIKRVGRK